MYIDEDAPPEQCMCVQSSVYVDIQIISVSKYFCFWKPISFVICCLIMESYPLKVKQPGMFSLVRHLV